MCGRVLFADLINPVSGASGSTGIAPEILSKVQKIANSAKASAASLEAHKALVAELWDELANLDFCVKAVYFQCTTIQNQLTEANKELEKVEGALTKNSDGK